MINAFLPTSNTKNHSNIKL